jgi:DNA-directed RNA polymerase beta subunit
MEQFDHKKAVEKLLNNVHGVFNEFFPYERGDYKFEVKDIKVEEPSISYEAQQSAFLNDDSIEAKVKGTVEVYHKGTLVKTHKDTVLTRVPYPTERGSYIAGGNEMVVLNRMQMRNGVYIHPMRDVSHTQMITAEARAGHQRFTINFDTNRAKIKIEGLSMDHGKTSPGSVDVVSLLKFLGVSDEQIKQSINNDELYESIMKNAGQPNGRKIYNAFFAKEFPGNEEAKTEILAHFNDRLKFDEDSQKINKQTIGSPIQSLDASSFLTVLSQLSKEYKNPGSSPSPDDLRFKEIKSAEDTVSEFVGKGIREWINNRLRRITYTDMNDQKKKILNAKPDQFIFKGTKELYSADVSELVDSANPLDAHQKLYKVTSLGLGGLNDKSASNSNRNMRDTAFGKIDALETPQSGRMGLVQHFASGAVVKNGRLYSKFYRVKDGSVDRSKVIDNIDPLDEFDEYIAFNSPAEMNKDNKGLVTSFKKDEVRVRHKGNFITVPKSKVTLIDQSPSAHMSHAISLVPFGAHNDGARMLMAAGMQKQSLALEDAEAPLVQSISDPTTGKTVEEEMADRASYILKSPVAGTVKDITDDFIEIDTGKGVER